MKTFLFTLALILSASSAMAAKCNVKALNDAEDGAVYYTTDHDLHKFIKKSDKTFCSEDEAESAGFDEAPETFSGSTARLVECIEDGVKSCAGYVIGQYRSLAIYDKACGGDASQSQIVNSFLENAKSDDARMAVAKFYGTTGALMDAYPCGGKARVARK